MRIIACIEDRLNDDWILDHLKTKDETCDPPEWKKASRRMPSLPRPVPLAISTPQPAPECEHDQRVSW